MATDAQINANRENARFSTGPRTEAGKAASSTNALKYGFTAKSALLPGEDEIAYQRLCEDTFEQWIPESQHDITLVQVLCDTLWRLSRCARLEAGILSADTIDFKALDIISRHEARLKKQYTSVIGEVRKRGLERIEQMKSAIDIRRADQLASKTDRNWKDIGFDFSVDKIDAAIRFQDALDDAQQALETGAL